MVRRLAVLSAVVASVTLLNSAGQPRLRISQVDTDDTAINAYLDVRDGDRFVDNLPAASIRGTVDGRDLTVESVRPLDPAAGILYLLLVDISKSVTADAFELFRSAASSLVETLGPADRMAVYSIGEDVTLDVPATANKQALKDRLAQLQPTASRTVLFKGLDLAIQYAQSKNKEWPKRRAILVLSDGQDDGSGLLAQDIRRRLESDRVPVFATAYRPERLTAQARTGLEVLRNLAVTSGGFFEEATPTDIGRVHQRVHGAVRQTHVARFTCRNCGGDQVVAPLTVSYSAGTLTVSDVVNIRLVPCPSCDRVPTWVYWASGAGALLLVVVIVGTAVRLRKRKARKVGPLLPPLPNLPMTVPPLPRDRSVAPLPPIAPAPVLQQPLTLTVVHGGKSGQRFSGVATTAKPLVAGSGAGCDIVLSNDPLISARQFEVRIEGPSVVVVRDLADGKTLKNGVLIVNRAKLEDGDTIGAGSTELRVRFGAS